MQTIFFEDYEASKKCWELGSELGDVALKVVYNEKMTWAYIAA